MRVLVFFLFSLRFAPAAENLLAKGRAAMERGDYEKAETYFREQTKATPDSAEARSDLGAVLAREGRVDAAIEEYRAALRADPKLTPVYLNMGIAYYRAGRYQDAIAPLTQFLKTSREDFRARELLAISQVECALYKQGIAALEALNNEKPGSPAVLFALAGAHIRAGDEDRGRELLQKLETMDLPPAPVHLLEGMLLYRSKLYDEAEKELNEALRLDPKSAPTLAALGRLRLRVNDDAAAIDLLEKALAIQPQDAESNYQLGVLLGRNGQPGPGRKYLEKALEQRTGYPDPMYFLAKMDLAAGQPRNAVKLLERASQLAPNQENILFLLARAYREAGDARDANLTLTEFRKLQSLRLERDQKAMGGATPIDPTQPLGSDPQP